MSIWEAVLLGVIQGLTEFLPISSTAHLVAARQFLHHPHPEDAFTTVIQLGTLFAVFAYFRSDIWKLLVALVRDFRTFQFGSSPDSRLAWLIVLGTFPVGIVGLLFKKKIKALFYDLPTMGIVAILFALLMLAAELWSKIRRVDQGKAELGEHDVTWREALWIGVWQMLALMPGASRSGTTITGGLFAGLSRSAAARFSFLLSIPSMTAAGLKELYDEYKLLKNPALEDRPSLYASGDNLLSLAIATVVSGVVGYLAIAWLLGFLRRYNMGTFVIYRLILGALILWWCWR